MLSKRALLRLFKFLLPIAIIVFVVIHLKKELEGLSLAEAIKAIKSIPSGGFIFAIVVGAIAVFTMFFYDYILVRSLKGKASFGKIFRVSWIANSFNGIFGFGGLAGATLRALLYRDNVKKNGQLVKGIAWMAPSLLSGLSILSFFVIIDVLPVRAVLASNRWLWIALSGIFLFLPAYILLSKWKGRATASAKTTLMYTVVSLVEWLTAGSTAYVMLRLLGVSIGYPEALGAFVIAAVAGTISLVPGGLGSFDLIFIIAMESLGVDKGVALSALLLYRLVYYFIPFGLGLIIAAFEMSGVVVKHVEEQGIIQQTKEAWGVFWTIQRVLLQKLGDGSLAVLTFVGGMALFFTVLIPNSIDRDESMHVLFPDWVIYFASGLTLAFALILLGLTKGIYKRTQRAYVLSICTIAGAAVTSILRGLYIETSVGLLLLGLLLVLLRKQFNRVRIEVSVFGIIVYTAFTGFLLYFFYIITLFTSELTQSGDPDFSEVVYTPLLGLNIITAVAITFTVVFTVIGSYWFDRTRRKIVPGVPASFHRLEMFLNENGGNVLSHLGYLGDKRFFISHDGKALLQFVRKGNRLIVLGDPSGHPDSFPELLELFLDKVDRYGYHVIFYQVQSDLMPLYHDLGFRFFKLGEEAVVDLRKLSQPGRKRTQQQVLKHQYEREGYVFEVVQPPFLDHVFEEMKQVSDAFLDKKKEKGFSMGYFDRDYLERAPIAVLRRPDGEMVAFASIMPVYQAHEVSVDLVRIVPGESREIMDVLFMNVFEWAKEVGYQRFNMGLAPLANVGQRDHSFFSERIAAAVFNNLSFTFSFCKIREQKEKYDPKWGSKYLAYRRNRFLPWTLFLVLRLINKGGDTMR
ncbi:bifunctional lysylphosphatidylglycerol flippase/synthetase MprF [Paenibacillus sp. KN14-4R]|uniref:bifunctional lysylphosphatidylglycerol flippase/synthetase MprF n=1 Tax=Paenibacillus sp. KN14-4R TaxID=3445773 RepID=UPI003FA0A6BB